RHFAATLAAQATFALDNAILYEELRDQERIKRELEIAREVQQRLLPSEMPCIDGFELDAICLPAQEVGGDYFDFFPINRDLLGIVIADVSGKGTSASFYMAEIKGMMNSLTAIYKSPKSVLVQLNQHLYDSLEKKVFATMIYGVLHVKARTFTFARAGHNSLLRKPWERSCEFLTPPGIGLGLDPGKEFEESLSEETIALDNGDTLVLYTDGITESMDEKHELFGEERLLDIIQKAGFVSPVELKETIFNNIRSFSDGAYQHDDLTMVILQKCRSL
ncbi:MAG: PP2C family protein-serine/threonine phosphatase, partial [bacterium]